MQLLAKLSQNNRQRGIETHCKTSNPNYGMCECYGFLDTSCVKGKGEN